jgi:hypothetical protein
MSIPWPIKAALALLALYLPPGLYLDSSYFPQPSPAFARSPAGGFAFIIRAPTLDGLADSYEIPARSSVILLEDGHPLGPAHSLHTDIRDVGHGRFSHWRGIGIVFSTSDNSNPNKNGRAYAVVNQDRP